MINFNREFGYPSFTLFASNDKLKFKYHRYRTNMKVTSKCSCYVILLISVKSKIQLSDICKKCLSTFNAEEIEDLKYWLILKKLGVSV